jgi:lactate permease
VLPAIVVCGVSFAAAQFYVSNYVGPELTDIVSSLTCIGAMVVTLKVWKPRTIMRLEGETAPTTTPPRYTAGQILAAWSPYMLLVVFVLIWGEADIKRWIDAATTKIIPVPGLHNMIIRVPPVTPAPAPYAANYAFVWLSAAGTACFFACVATCLLLRVSPGRFAGAFGATFKQLRYPIVTIGCMLGLAYLMNYSGMTSTLGLQLAATGTLFPFFSAVIGWMGVFLTGSDTSANALFGNLQVVTANAIGLNPVLTASVNSAAGVMGKMISLQSIAVAVAATGLTPADEGKLFRFTIKHSILLTIVMGIVSMLYAYVFPNLVPVSPPR